MKKQRLLILLQLVLLSALVAPQSTSQSGCDIDGAVEDLVQSKFRSWTSGPRGTQDRYISNISFIDGVSKTQFLSEEGRLIDAAVRDGMRIAATGNQHIHVNHATHSVPNNDASVNKLISIWNNSYLTLDQRFKKASTELLSPHNVDVLVTGVIIDSGTFIQVRPMGVSKPDNTIKLKDLRYANRSALFTRVNGTTVLTRKAHEEIQKAVKELLDSL